MQSSFIMFSHSHMLRLQFECLIEMPRCAMKMTHQFLSKKVTSKWTPWKSCHIWSINKYNPIMFPMKKNHEILSFSSNFQHPSRPWQAFSSALGWKCHRCHRSHRAHRPHRSHGLRRPIHWLLARHLEKSDFNGENLGEMEVFMRISPNIHPKNEGFKSDFMGKSLINGGFYGKKSLNLRIFQAARLWQSLTIYVFGLQGVLHFDPCHSMVVHDPGKHNNPKGYEKNMGS